MFDELKDQALNLAKEQAKEHKDAVADAAEQAAGKLGDAVDSATGGKFGDQIDAATQGTSEKVSGLLDQE
jgi:hypothetical protein